MSDIMSDIEVKQNRARTPCIGVCSTGIGDSVCRGCKRFLHEVVHWNAYSEQEQRHVLQRIEAFLNQIISAKLEVVDEAKLFRFLSRQGIARGNYVGATACVYVLLKAGAAQMGAWGLYGIQPKAPHINKSPLDLRDEIDREFYTLSCAHYQRYFEVTHAGG